jgi:hypothetical protein
MTIHSYTLQSWYLAFRKRGERPTKALQYARWSIENQTKANKTLLSLSPSSRSRIDSFVDCFIRSEAVENLTCERDSDFINEPERADRCHNTAEYSADGKTRSEVIEDWRDAFSYWLSDRRRGKYGNDPERFESAVRAYFTTVELWHEFNGSLFQEIG